jgi:hypothetical protein
MLFLSFNERNEMRHFNAQILAQYSGLLITVGTVISGYIFMPEIHAIIHPQKPTPPPPSQPIEVEVSDSASEFFYTDSRSESPVSSVESEDSRSTLSLLIISNEEDMVDIEAELEHQKSHESVIDISTPMGLFQAIEYNYSEIPGKRFAQILRYMVMQPYFYSFFGIADKTSFQNHLEKILVIIEFAKDQENKVIHIPECYQLFRQDEFYRINHSLDEPRRQSPFTPLI